MDQNTTSAEAIQTAFHQFSYSLSPELKERMNGRLERGMEIALSGGVTAYDPSSLIQFKVKSSDPAQFPYMVDLRVRSCTCPDHAKGHFCKHRVAAHIFRLAYPHIQATTSEPEVLESQTYNEIGQSIVWACIRQDGRAIGVEVLGIENDLIWVQALPLVNEDGKLEPQFPFPEGCYTWKVQFSELEHIRIFQNA